MHGWLARGGRGGRGEPRAPPRAPSRRPRPAPRAGAVYGRDWGFQPTGAGPLASRGRPLQAAASLHSFLFQALLLLGAARRPKRDHIFVLALDGRDGVLGRLKCLVYKNHKSIARQPMWVKINPKQKTCLPRGPGGLRPARGCPQRTPRPAPGERGVPRLIQWGGCPALGATLNNRKAPGAGMPTSPPRLSVHPSGVGPTGRRSPLGVSPGGLVGVRTLLVPLLVGQRPFCEPARQAPRAPGKGRGGPRGDAVAGAGRPRKDVGGPRGGTPRAC